MEKPGDPEGLISHPPQHLHKLPDSHILRKGRALQAQDHGVILLVEWGPEAKMELLQKN